MHPDGKVLREETAKLMIHRSHAEARSSSRHRLHGRARRLGKGCSASTFGHSGSTGTLAWADPATDTTFVLLTALPKNVAGQLILYPVSDLVSAGA
jgi:CubicO group peptidase (beta-lactamase class C family)